MAILVIPNVLSYPLVLFCTLDILKVKTIELKSKDIADLIKVVKASRRMRNSHLQMYLKCKRKKKHGTVCEDVVRKRIYCFKVML